MTLIQNLKSQVLKCLFSLISNGYKNQGIVSKVYVFYPPPPAHPVKMKLQFGVNFIFLHPDKWFFLILYTCVSTGFIPTSAFSEKTVWHFLLLTSWVTEMCHPICVQVTFCICHTNVQWITRMEPDELWREKEVTEGPALWAVITSISVVRYN